MIATRPECDLSAYTEKKWWATPHIAHIAHHTAHHTTPHTSQRTGRTISLRMMFLPAQALPELWCEFAHLHRQRFIGFPQGNTLQRGMMHGCEKQATQAPHGKGSEKRKRKTIFNRPCRLPCWVSCAAAAVLPTSPPRSAGPPVATPAYISPATLCSRCVRALCVVRCECGQRLFENAPS